MKAKIIKSILSKKFNDWIDSIEDEEVKKLAAKNTIITGGAIASMLLNEDIKDFDLYFRDKKTTKAVAQYYVDKWNKIHGTIKNKIGNEELLFVLDGEDVAAWKRGEKSLSEIAPNYKHDFLYSKLDKSGRSINSRFECDTNDDNQLRVSRMITNTTEDRIKVIYPSDGVISESQTNISSNEIFDTLDDLSEIDEAILDDAMGDKKERYRPVFLTTNAITLSDKIQIIIRFYGEPNEIHSNYDFVHCCCYWDSKTKQLTTPNDSLLAILNKDLFYKGSKYPICSIIRAKKFINRGWKINAGQYVKMAFQVSKLNLNNIDVLEDQLVGIDTLYFMQVVAALRQMQEKDPNFTFDETYLASIIDRIF